MNLLTTFISQGMTAVTMIIITPVLLKGLGEANFGVYSVLLNLIILFSIIDFGGNLGIIRKMIHQVSESKQLIPTLFYFYLSLSILLTPVLYFYLKGSIHEGSNSLQYALILTCIIVSNIIIMLFDSVLQSLHFIYVTKIIRTIKTIVEFLGWFMFIKYGSIIYLLGVTVIVNIIYSTVLYNKVYQNHSFSLSPREFDFKILQNHLSYSIWYFIAALATALIYNIQILLFNRYSNSAIVAHFFIVTKFYEIIRVAASNFSQVLFPKIIHLESEKEWGSIKKMYFTSLFKAFLLAILIATVIITIGDMLFVRWSNLNDPSTLQLFHYYLIFIVFIIVDNVSVIYLAALKLNTWPTIVSVLQGIVSIGCSILFINKYGLLGAFYASMLSFMITNMIFNPAYLLNKIKHNAYKIST